MAESNACSEGKTLALTGDACPKISLPEPDTKAKPSNLIPARDLAPRGPRFSRLSDAYFKITSRQSSNNTFRKASNQSDLSPITPSVTGSSSSLAGSPRLVKSQNDLQSPSSFSAMPSSTNIGRPMSFNSIELFDDMLPKMGREDNDNIGPNEQIEDELLNLKIQSNDTTGSTIEGILAQYDACTPSLKVERANPREYRMNVDLSLFRPPQDSLPELPAADIRPVSVRQSEYDSPMSDSSITDSQHLLDVEAQAYELEEVRRALVPSPLNIAQSCHGIEIRREQQHDSRHDGSDLTVYEGPICTNNSFTHQEAQGYKTYLQPPMERDISQTLRHLGRNAGYSIGTFCSADAGDYLPRQIRPQGKIFSPTRLPKTSGEKPLRQIKVVIGRESGSFEDIKDNRHNVQDDMKDGHHNMPSEDGDWVTETTSDAGFGPCNSALPGQALTKHFKRAGSSLADYSDDGNESTVDRFGSLERIIPHPGGIEKRRPSNMQRLNGSKLTFLLPRQHNAFLRNANRLWASAAQGGPGQFRPHILSQNMNPFRDISSRRLVFDFDQNAPPKYEFRDSVSDYEPAKASTKGNCGTNQYGTYGSLPSLVAKIGEDGNSTSTDADSEQSARLDGDKNPSDRSSRESKVQQTPCESRDMRLSIYAADRRKQLEELNRQEFAVASSFYDPPSASSVRSKFNFELLPLDLAQHKNKVQRDCGETNETESATTRLKRKQSSQSINLPAINLERPAKAFFTSRDLSVNFSTPNWRVHNPASDASGDTSTPFSMGRSDEIGPVVTRKCKKSDTSGSLDPPSPFGIPSIAKRPCYGQKERYHTPVRSQHRLKLPPSFIAPDDYVSDRAHRIRQIFFYIIVALSILPFVGVLALGGAFREAFKWATRSEVDQLTAHQRRFIKWMLFAESVIYTGAVVTVVVYFVVKNKAQN
ncbi:hypothetical protein F4859DRAFT_524419 [Xylaria cf. heliscus]|nr:hypothetical protein F4859DRAFT_524419 [Xylaria cf. heliscus]